MPKRGDGIHKRKDGRWEGRYKIGNYPSGATKYNSVYGHSYNEVKEKLGNIGTNPFDEKTSKSNVLFETIIYQWLCENKIKLKSSTFSKYSFLIERHIVPELGKIPANQINSGIINNYIDNKMKNGSLTSGGKLSPAYVRTIIFIISSTVQFGINEHICLPLTRAIVRPKIKEIERIVLPLKTQKRIEESIFSNTCPTGLGILLSLNMGLRIGEVCALCWEDIDFSKQVIHIRKTIARVRSDDFEKTGQRTKLIIDSPKTKSSNRDIPISKKMNKLLSSLYPKNESYYIVSNSNTFLSPRTFEYRFHNYLESVGVEQINYHALRHTFATRCIEAGVDVKSLSEILGHSNVSITLKTYVHSSMELKRNQMEKLMAFCD